jgi:hypothetical protein
VCVSIPNPVTYDEVCVVSVYPGVSPRPLYQPIFLPICLQALAKHACVCVCVGGGGGSAAAAALGLDRQLQQVQLCRVHHGLV